MGDMRRKIIKQGHNTLTITLPREWVKKYNIKPGDEIEIKEEDKSLMLLPMKSSNEKLSVTLDISNMTEPMMWRMLLSAYRAGYDEIIIRGIKGGKKDLYSAFSYNTLKYLESPHEHGILQAPIEVVSACINRLIGMDIIEQKENYCIARELVETTYKQFDGAFRRMFILLTILGENVVNALKGDTEGIKSVHIIDTSLDKFQDFCLRVLNKLGYEVYRKTPIIYAYIFILELIGDEFKRMGEHIIKEGKKITSPFIKNLCNEMIKQINRTYKLFYNFSEEKAQDIYVYYDNKMKVEAEKERKKLNKEELELLHHLKKIGVYIKCLVELRNDMEFR